MKNDTKIGRQCLRLTLGLLVIWTTSAQAAEVFGLKFGQPVPFPECERDQYGHYQSVFTINNDLTITELPTCFEKDEHPYDIDILFSKEQKPKIIGGHHLKCILVDGRFEGVKFWTYGIKDIERVLAALNTKYGKPSSIEKPIVQNAMGAQYEDLIADWTLPNLYVRFHGLAESVDSCVVNIRTPKGRAEYSRRTKPRDDPRPL